MFLAQIQNGLFYFPSIIRSDNAHVHKGNKCGVSCRPSNGIKHKPPARIAE